MPPVDNSHLAPRSAPVPASVNPPREPLLRTAAPEFHNEPLTDFSKAENRTVMQRAVDLAPRQFGQDWPLWINGQAILTEEQLPSLNPSHKLQVIGRASSATAEHVDAAVQAAQAECSSWHQLGAQRRGDLLRAAAARMRGARFDLAAWMVYECGKPWREADGDVTEAIDFLEYYATEAVALELSVGLDAPGEENRLTYMPRGVAAVIAPWNFPLAILTGMTAAALATGNPVIMKPAEQASGIAQKLMEIFRECDFPPGAVQLITGRGEVAGAALVEHPGVALICFTGSRAVGLTINRKAAEVSGVTTPLVKRVIAEMGGKNAIVVDDDADLDEAVLGVVASAFGYQGQKCSACSRVIVLKPVYDAFVSRLVEAVRTLKVSPAEDPGCRVGPVIDEAARQNVLKYIEIGKREARTLLATDLGPLADEGCYVGPHVFADVKPTDTLAQEEIFGPVLAVLKADDLDEAFRIVNQSDYALTGGFFSRSPANLRRARQEMLVGNLYLNRAITGALVGRQPFGGFKMSGIGSKAGGPDYLLQFVLARTVTENTLRRGFAPEAPTSEGE